MENITGLIRTILAAISDVMVAGCLLVVIMLIFSFLEMELFGNWNVETFGSADDVQGQILTVSLTPSWRSFRYSLGKTGMICSGHVQDHRFLGWFYFIALTFVKLHDL